MSNLVNIVKNNFRKMLLVPIVAIPLLFYGCKKPDPDVLPVSSSASYSASPTEGEAPLSVHMIASGKSGDDPISAYRLHLPRFDKADTIIARLHPIDTNVVFNDAGIYTAYSEVIDAKNVSHASASKTITVTKDKPTANLELLTETFGKYSPLPVHLKLTGTDAKYPITKYALLFDNKTAISTNSIDTIITFYVGNNHSFSPYAGTHIVRGIVTNSKGVSDTTEIKTFNVNSNVGWNDPTDPLPDEINFFKTQNPTDEYNQLLNKDSRDAYLEETRIEDITHKVPTTLDTLINGTHYAWMCVQCTEQFEYNRNNWKNWHKYGGYNGEKFDSIYIYHGTEKEGGTRRAPVYIADVSPSHQINFAITGDNLSEINFIENMHNISRSNVRPGDGGGVPSDYPNLVLDYSYIYKGENDRNMYANIPAAIGHITGGVVYIDKVNPNVPVVIFRYEK